MLANDHEAINAALRVGLERARRNREGAPADYIPELARVDAELLSVAITCVTGEVVTGGDAGQHTFTFQSTAKLLLLAGLLEELGAVEVFKTVGSEPSGRDFASVARLETDGPLPSNPLVNAGAIALAGLLSGAAAERIEWILRWARSLYGTSLSIDEAVRASERATAYRNRSIAYLLKHTGVLAGDVDDALEAYFALCSLRGDVVDAARFVGLLANGGVDTKTGRRVLGPSTVAVVVSLMATCGMYNESGNYLAATGMPAKSGVSGLIVAIVPGVAGVAVCSPRINSKGGSVRGHVLLRHLSRSLGWHFALSGAELGARLSARVSSPLHASEHDSAK